MVRPTKVHDSTKTLNKRLTISPTIQIFLSLLSKETVCSRNGVVSFVGTAPLLQQQKAGEGKEKIEISSTQASRCVAGPKQAIVMVRLAREKLLVMRES